MPPKPKTTKKTEKAGRGGNIPPKEYRFSSTNQPTREARIRGQKKFRDRQNAKKELAEFFLEQDIKLKINDHVQTMPVLKAIGWKIRDFIFNPNAAWNKDTFMAVLSFLEKFYPAKEDLGSEFPIKFIIENVPPEFRNLAKKRNENEEDEE